MRKIKLIWIAVLVVTLTGARSASTQTVPVSGESESYRPERITPAHPTQVLAAVENGHPDGSVFQTSGQRGGHGQGMGRRRLDRLRQMKVLELLNLDDETEDHFLTLYREHHREHRRIAREKMSTVKALGDLLREKNSSTVDIEKLVARIEEFDRQREQARQQFYDEARGLLTLEQFGKMLVFEARFEIERLGKVAEFRGRQG